MRWHAKCLAEGAPASTPPTLQCGCSSALSSTFILPCCPFHFRVGWVDKYGCPPNLLPDVTTSVGLIVNTSYNADHRVVGNAGNACCPGHLQKEYILMPWFCQQESILFTHSNPSSDYLSKCNWKAGKGERNGVGSPSMTHTHSFLKGQMCIEDSTSDCSQFSVVWKFLCCIQLYTCKGSFHACSWK